MQMSLFIVVLSVFMAMFLLFVAPIAIGASLGILFGFIPFRNRAPLWTLSSVVGGSAFWVFLSTLEGARNTLFGGPLLFASFGFIAALWITVYARERKKKGAELGRTP